jgi:hypothetical protein
VTAAGDFRRDPPAAGREAEKRDVPEGRPGAEPARDDSPEFSRGGPLDEAQPSARPRGDPVTEGDAVAPAGTRRASRRIGTGERAYIESLLEGAPLPATRADLIEYAERQGDRGTARRLRALPSRRYDWLDEVGEALEPVQPTWPRERRVPVAEAGSPPGGAGYGIDPDDGPAAA